MYKFTLASILLFCSLIPLNSQITKPNAESNYYDYELDYFPKIKALNIIEASGTLEVYAGEFKAGLELIADNFEANTYQWTRFSGRIMETSGTYPFALKAHAMWVRITINAAGSVEEVIIFPGSTAADKSLETALSAKLSNARINPALVDGQVVSTTLFYTIDYL